MNQTLQPKSPPNKNFLKFKPLKWFLQSSLYPLIFQWVAVHIKGLPPGNGEVINRFRSCTPRKPYSWECLELNHQKTRIKFIICKEGYPYGYKIKYEVA